MRKIWTWALVLWAACMPIVAEESLSAGEARELLKQYQLQLEELESGISAYREELGSISEQAKARSNQYTVRSSETMGIVRLTRIDDQGVPRLYMFNKMEFISRKDNANLQVGLFIQNDLGMGDWDTMESSGRSLSLNTLWRGQRLNLTVGSFYTSDTPLVIGKAVRAKELWPETRRSFQGVRFNASFPGLNLQGFFSRVGRGGGEEFDRYAIFSKMDTQLGGLKSSFSLFRWFDDIASAPASGPALSTTLLSYQFDTRSLPGTRFMDVQGETNLAWVDHDSLRGPDSTLEFAARLIGQLRTRVPLRYNYYFVSYDYPATYSAVHSVEEDYYYQYEEDPWLPDYITNHQRLYVEAGGFATPLGTMMLDFDLVGEIEPALDSRKTFGYYGGKLSRYLNVPIDYLYGSRLQLAGGQYWTDRAGAKPIDVKQNMGEVSLTQTIGDTVIIGGYQQLILSGELSGQKLQEKINKPFAELHWSLGSSNWTWRGEFFRGDVNKNYQKITARFPVGSASYIRCRFEDTRGDERLTEMLVEYRSQF